MRVITGKYKGRSLVAPKHDARPTLDRMKETLFNIVNSKIQGASVLDLFAGSGQLAIECLSRGADRAILCDNSSDAVAAIKANFEKIGLKPDLMFCDFRDCLKRLPCQMDLVFVDPPYKAGVYNEVLQAVDELNVITPNGWIICEHASVDELPSNVGSLVCFDSRKMGTVRFSFYQRSEECE
ncbi:MAG: 16S rRNA (guanine(966)-N(2))-methyltransferase RsmD [Clostridiales bacterium]|nr:16S rRNA (guanine(966)-N(2))-methyltransferase RsmD [Clostridiales bacterium]